MPSQTCFIERNGAYNAAVMPLVKPKLPENIKIEDDYVEYYDKFFSLFTFYCDGKVVQRTYSGTTYTWFTKPTVADAIEHANRKDIIGDYFQFNPDGSVKARWYGQEFFWPSETPDERVIEPIDQLYQGTCYARLCTCNVCCRARDDDYDSDDDRYSDDYYSSRYDRY